MVVLAVIALITAVVISNQGAFNKTFVLANTAYDVALTLRSAETYGLGTRATSGGAVNTGYGLHFQSGTPSSFKFFADAYPSPRGNNCHGLPAGGAGAPDAQPGDCVYTASDTLVQTYTLGNGIIVQNFCARSSGSWSCMDSGLSTLDIIFMRPNSVPFMSVDGTYTGNVTAACITLTSPSGGGKYISVSSSGQIIANAASCP